MRVAFLGSQSIGAACLRVVLDAGHDVVGVATFEPDPHESWTDEVASLVDQRRLPHLPVRRFADPAELHALQEVEPDVTFVIGWRWLIPPKALRVPPLGTIGIHGSLLPRLRGFAPINWALIRGEARTGPTLFYIDDGMDTGDIIASRSFPITEADDAGTVRDRVEAEAARLLHESLPRIAAGDAARVPQNHDLATFGARRRPDDGLIDWAKPARSVFNLVRGVTRPYPGAVAILDGRRFRVWRVALVTGAPVKPGTVVGRGAGGLPALVSAADGIVELIEIEAIDERPA